MATDNLAVCNICTVNVKEGEIKIFTFKNLLVNVIVIYFVLWRQEGKCSQKFSEPFIFLSIIFTENWNKLIVWRSKTMEPD